MRSSWIMPIGAVVVRRICIVSRLMRRWFDPPICSRHAPPQPQVVRSRIVMRGLPDTGRTMRAKATGR